MTHTLNHTANADSAVHKLDPRVKIIIVVTFVIVVVSTPAFNPLAFIFYSGLLSWACAFTSISMMYYIRRILLVLPFSILASIALPFVGKPPMLELFDGGLHISIPGLWMFIGIIMKSSLGVGATLWLISTTPFSSLATGLRKMKMPRLVVDILSLTYRYLFVLTEEISRLKRAAIARGYKATWLGQAFLIGQLIGKLFLRSYERSERLFYAMRLRGFNGSFPTDTQLKFRRSDVLVLLIVLPVIIFARCL